MTERRSPRTLRDVSHLFLSSGASAHCEPRRGSASIWLAVAGASMNRAHLAAGTAMAFAREGMCVSILELSGSLPNVGYYFGMEPAGYLAPAIDRTALVSGTWNEAVRYCFSEDLASFERYRGEALPPGAPHALLAAFPCPRERDAARFLEALSGTMSVLDDDGLRAGRAPDAIVAAGCGENAGRARAFLAGVRDAFPSAAGVFVTDDPGAGRGSEAEERLTVPGELRSSWGRRMPPAEAFFGELAAGLLLVVSQRRRKAMHHAANA